MKQKNVGGWYGMLKILAMQMSIYVSIATVVMMAATFHHTTLIQWLEDWGLPQIPVWLFFVILLAGGLLFLFIEYKFFLSSFYTAWNDQWWEHDNPMKTEIEQIKDNQKKIMEKLGL